MNNLHMIIPGLWVGEALDSDGDLEVSVGVDAEISYGWLTRREILALITYLGRVLDDADKQQATGNRKMSEVLITHLGNVLDDADKPAT